VVETVVVVGGAVDVTVKGKSSVWVVVLVAVDTTVCVLVGAEIDRFVVSVSVE